MCCKFAYFIGRIRKKQQVAFSTIATTGIPSFAFNHLKEREDKIIGKKEVKTEYYLESKEITYFVIEKVEEESIVKLIEKMLVNIILTGCNGGLC